MELNRIAGREEKKSRHYNSFVYLIMLYSSVAGVTYFHMTYVALADQAQVGHIDLFSVNELAQYVFAFLQNSLAGVGPGCHRDFLLLDITAAPRRGSTSVLFLYNTNTYKFSQFFDITHYCILTLLFRTIISFSNANIYNIYLTFERQIIF